MLSDILVLSIQRIDRFIKVKNNSEILYDEFIDIKEF